MAKLPVWVHVEGNVDRGQVFRLKVYTWHPAFWWSLWRDIKWVPLPMRVWCFVRILWHAIRGDWHVNEAPNNRQFTDQELYLRRRKGKP